MLRTHWLFRLSLVGVATMGVVGLMMIYTLPQEVRPDTFGLMVATAMVGFAVVSILSAAIEFQFEFYGHLFGLPLSALLAGLAYWLVTAAWATGEVENAMVGLVAALFLLIAAGLTVSLVLQRERSIRWERRLVSLIGYDNFYESIPTQ